MDYINFQKIVIEKIKSVSLKNAIRNDKTIFQPIELLKIIYKFIEKYEDRVFLLKKMLSVVDDEKMCSYINFIIDELENNLQKLQGDNSNCIFELHIKDTPDSYDERYICKSFNSAIVLIDEFYKEYSCTPDTRARYEIVKRKIYDSSCDSFSEDFIISCSLDYNKNICDICSEQNGYFYQCDGICYECDLLCMSNINIRFPAFVGYKDLVRSQDIAGSVNYGVAWDDPENQGEECYIIPLDCFALRYGSFDKAHDFHEHVPYPYVEKAYESDLTDEYKNIYNEYMKYLEKNE